MPNYHGEMVPCPGGCGKNVPKRIKDGQQKRCLECAIARAIEYQESMRSHSGPDWERWLATAGPQGRPSARKGGVGIPLDDESCSP